MSGDVDQRRRLSLLRRLVEFLPHEVDEFGVRWLRGDRFGKSCSHFAVSAMMGRKPAALVYAGRAGDFAAAGRNSA
jgi:hypothetical protein